MNDRNQTADQATRPLRLFVSSAPADANLQNSLVRHLALLRQLGKVHPWSADQLPPGSDWIQEVNRALEDADVALLLLSKDALASAFIQDIELPKLLQQHMSRGLRLIPVVARACNWRHHPWLGKLTPLPRSGKPIAAHKGDSREQVLADLVQEIANLVGVQSPTTRAETTITPAGRSMSVLQPNPTPVGSLGARRTCPAAPRALKEAMAQKRVVPFIGAGLSRAVKLPDGRRLPDARELADGLRELVLAECLPPSKPGPSWEIFDRYLKEGRAREAISEILKAFPSIVGTKPDDQNIGLKNRWFRELLAAAATIPPTPHHAMLNMLPFPFFMTVNYDRVLEQSLYPQPEVVTFREPSLVPLFLGASQRFLFKLHGDITRVHEVVEALETWDRFYDEGRAETKVFIDQITRIFREYTVLFLGCSFTNEEYNKIPEFLGRALSGNDRIHFALVPVGNRPRESLANAHIQFLEYSADDEHSQVWEFLTQIAPSQQFTPTFGESRQAFFTEEQRPDYLEQQLRIEAQAKGLRYLTPSMTNALATEEYIQTICRENLEQARRDLPPGCDFADWRDKVCRQMIARQRGLRTQLSKGCEVRVLCELTKCEQDSRLGNPLVKRRYRDLIELMADRGNDLEIRLAPVPFKDRKVQSFASMLCPSPEREGGTDVATAFAAQSTADASTHMVVNMIHYNTSFAESRLVLFEREWVHAMDEATSLAKLEELFPK